MTPENEIICTHRIQRGPYTLQVYHVSNCVHVILQPHSRWMSHDVTSCADGQEVVQENRGLKKAAGSFPGSFKTSEDGGTEREQPVQIRAKEI